jgi:transposase
VSSAALRCFANNEAGHQALITFLTDAQAADGASPGGASPGGASPGGASPGGAPIRVVVEASGIYSVDLCHSLSAAEGIEVMLLNPRVAKDYRCAHLQRSKTDRGDAALLCDYALRMPFVRWQPPATEYTALRQIARRIQALIVEQTREQSRLRAARSSQHTAAVVINDIEVNLRHLQRRIDEMVRQAQKLIAATAELARAYDLLVSVRGIATKSAVQLLGELMLLPADMSVREWVAYAGLDVRHHQSGRSVREKPRISKVGNANLRRILYMPALVATRQEAAVNAFYHHLQARGKPKMVALVAVMRKLLHSIYGMLKHDTPFDGTKFYQPAPDTA